IFAMLYRSTVQGWIEANRYSWKSEGLQQVAEGRYWKPGKGRIPILNTYSEILDAIQMILIGFQNASMPINTTLACSVILSIIGALKPDILFQLHNGYVPILSLRAVQQFLNKQFNWIFCASTKASQKLPNNWEDLCEKTFVCLVYSIATSDIHPSLLINADQMMILPVPGGNQHTYAEKRSKQVSLYGLE
ncbi:hypothetical protein BDD12DRAFT_744875, partial [Trichophaea hybrida]